ncbi:hypothetical protein [Peribacillus loiseleuriae]|uniref:hypothetical protein n=1 Tax=Peribacillus loiseleuriae TaxID=1679170 RepID=UPI00069E8CCC|nr:hypothetical protein [Peribacillus loiseleuriae]
MRGFFKKRLSLAITLVMFVFGVLVTTFLVMEGIAALLQHLGIISFSGHPPQNPGGNNGNPLFPLFILFSLCILLGTALTAFLSKKSAKSNQQGN